MAKRSQPLPRTLQPDREAQAHEQVGHTEISPGLAVFLTTAFLLSLCAISLGQQALEVREHLAGKRAAVLPGSFEVFAAPLRAGRAFADSGGSPWTRLVAANRALADELRRYESTVEEDSRFNAFASRATQWLISALLRTGNEQAYAGRDGWLFLRSSVDYVTGPPFLDPSDLARRSWASDALPQSADPRPAIYEFKRAIELRGARFLLMICPEKPSIHPEKLVRGYDGPALDNESLRPFIDELTRNGVEVFNPTELLREHAYRAGRPAFMKTDTHWNPEAMELVADALAERIRAMRVLPEAPHAGFNRQNEPEVVDNYGDLLSVLRLPVGQSLFPRETAAIHPVFTKTGQPWQASRTADVLVLGNSFSNIFSQVGLGWGASAGLMEQLAYRLQRPIDTLLRNGKSAHATRAMLARELALGRDRLADKKLVIWQMATREFVGGDWRRIDLSVAQATSRRFLRLAPGTTASVRATIAALAHIPRPGATIYADQIRAAHLVDIEGPAIPEDANEALVYAWGMRDNAWTSFGRERVGQRLTFRLRPWTDVEGDLDKVARSEVDDQALLAAEPLFAEEILP